MCVFVLGGRAGLFSGVLCVECYTGGGGLCCCVLCLVCVFCVDRKRQNDPNESKTKTRLSLWHSGGTAAAGSACVLNVMWKWSEENGERGFATTTRILQAGSRQQQRSR